MSSDFYGIEQLLTDDGRAWLAAVQGSRWLIEARY